MKKVKHVIFRLLCFTNILLTYHAAVQEVSRQSGQCPSECGNCVRPTIHLCGASHIRGPQGLFGLRGLPAAFLKAYPSAHGIGIKNFLARHLFRPGGFGIFQPGSLFGPGGIRFRPGEFGLPGLRPGDAIQGGFRPEQFRLPGSYGIGPGGVMYDSNRPGVDGSPHDNIAFGPGGIIPYGYGPGLEGIPQGNQPGGYGPGLEGIPQGNQPGGYGPGLEGITQGNRPGGYGPDMEGIIQGNSDNRPGGIIQGGIDPAAKGTTGISPGEIIPENISQGDIGIRPESILNGIGPGAKGTNGISPSDTLQGGITQGDNGIKHTLVDSIQGILGPGTGKDVFPSAGIAQENIGIQPGSDISAGIGSGGIDPAQGSIGIIPDRIIQGGIVPRPGGLVQGNTGGSGAIPTGSGGNTGNVPGGIHFEGPINGNYGSGSGVINSGIPGSGMIAPGGGGHSGPGGGGHSGPGGGGHSGPGGGGHSGSTFVEGIGPSGIEAGGVAIEGNGIKEMEMGDIGPEGIIFGNMGTDFTGPGAIRVKDDGIGINNYGMNGFTNYASGTIPSGSSHYKQKNSKISFNYGGKIENNSERSHDLQGTNPYITHYTDNGYNSDIEELSKVNSNVYLSNASNFKSDNNETDSIRTDIHDTNLPIARERERVTTSRANLGIETDKESLKNAVTNTDNNYAVALQLDEGNKLQPIIFNENEMNFSIPSNNSFIQGEPFSQDLQIEYGDNSQDNPQTIQQPLQDFYPIDVQNLRDNPTLQDTILKGKDVLGKRTLVKVFHFKGNDLTGGKVYDFKDGLKGGKIYHINGKDVNGSNILHDGENITDFLFGDPLFGEHGLGINKIQLNNLVKEFQRENRNITNQESDQGDTSRKFPLREGGMVIKEYLEGPDGVINEGSEGKVTHMVQQYLNNKKMEGLRMGNRSQEHSTEEVNENENAISIEKTQLDEQNDIVGLERLSKKKGAIKERDLSVEGQTKGATKLKDKGIREGEVIAVGSISEETGINNEASNGERPSIVEPEAGSDEGVSKGLEIKYGGGLTGVGFHRRGRIELGGGRELGTTEEAVLGYSGGASGHGVGKGDGVGTDSGERTNGRLKFFGIGFRSRAKGLTGKGEDFGEGSGTLGGGDIRKGRGNGRMGVFGFGFRGTSGISGRAKESGASSLSEGIGLNRRLFLRRRDSHQKNRRNRHNSNGRRSHNRKTGYSRF